MSDVDQRDTLIASQAAEIEQLKLCLEPGKASAIVRAVFDIAERKCGHDPFSARHGLTTIDEYLDRQAALIQSMREAIENAPHDPKCSLWTGSYGQSIVPCNCWKADALAQVSAG